MTDEELLELLRQESDRVEIAIARKQLSENGNPPLEFVVDRSHILALVRRAA